MQATCSASGACGRSSLCIRGGSAGYDQSTPVVHLQARKAIVHRLGSWYWNEVCRREYESQDRKVNERPVEFHFVFDQLSKSSVRSVLDRYDGAAQRSTKLWVRRHGDGQCAGLSAERHLHPDRKS